MREVKKKTSVLCKANKILLLLFNTQNPKLIVIYSKIVCFQNLCESQRNLHVETSSSFIFWSRFKLDPSKNRIWIECLSVGLCVCLRENDLNAKISLWLCKIYMLKDLLVWVGVVQTGCEKSLKGVILIKKGYRMSFKRFFLTKGVYQMSFKEANHARCGFCTGPRQIGLGQRPSLNLVFV